MKTTHVIGLLLLVWLPLGAPVPAKAQDTVTIPESRLEELEQKERELERLKGEAAKAQDVGAQPSQLNGKSLPFSSTGPTPVPARVTPPMVSLPALKPDEVVESVDLANYYQADPAAADKRYRGQKITVRGEIVGFEKPMFIRNYKFLLLGNDRATRVVCDFVPPDNVNAVFPINHGSEMVNLVGETRVPIAKVGQVVLVKGECKGWRGGMVLLSGASFQPAR